MTTPGTTDLMWPDLEHPSQLLAVEAVPLADRTCPRAPTPSLNDGRP